MYQQIWSHREKCCRSCKLVQTHTCVANTKLQLHLLKYLITGAQILFHKLQVMKLICSHLCYNFCSKCGAKHIYTCVTIFYNYKIHCHRCSPVLHQIYLHMWEFMCVCVCVWVCVSLCALTLSISLFPTAWAVESGQLQHIQSMFFQTKLHGNHFFLRPWRTTLPFFCFVTCFSSLQAAVLCLVYNNKYHMCFSCWLLLLHSTASVSRLTQIYIVAFIVFMFTWNIQIHPHCTITLNI